MVKNEPVSLKRQTIYSIIPILDIYASYKIKHLRKFVLIMISVYVFGEIINWALFSPTYMLGVIPESTPNVVPSEYAEYDLIVNIIMLIGEILLSIYLIRKWSKEWNQKFESELYS